MALDAMVNAAWLHEHLGSENLIILDATLSTTVDGKEPPFKGLSIPGARFFDLKNNFSDPKSAFPNTLPSETDFQRAAQDLGINQRSKIVVYDQMGLYSSPRVWWLFKTMGHEQISVLDGGLEAWIKSGYATSSVAFERYEKGDFRATMNPELWLSFDQVKQNLEIKTFQLIDARSKGRFEGSSPEPRPNLLSGSIPHSVNVPYQKVLNGAYLAEASTLREVFAKEGAVSDKIAFTCGSGLTACIIALAHHMAYGSTPVVYDGSWTEWAELNNLKTDLNG
jgi:thiosulfate/3-mercaptopyruvate sulfurtransferase